MTWDHDPFFDNDPGPKPVNPDDWSHFTDFVNGPPPRGTFPGAIGRKIDEAYAKERKKIEARKAADKWRSRSKNPNRGVGLIPIIYNILKKWFDK